MPPGSRSEACAEPSKLTTGGGDSAGMGAAVWEALDQAPFGFILVLPEPARELHEPTAYAAKGPKPLSRQCMPVSSDDVPSGRITAGQKDIGVWVRRAPSGVAWGRCHLVCHWPSRVTNIRFCLQAEHRRTCASSALRHGPRILALHASVIAGADPHQERNFVHAQGWPCQPQLAPRFSGYSHRGTAPVAAI